MEKWIFVNNITSLDKLYVLTKEVHDNEITVQNHAEKFMDVLNRNGANRTAANTHPLNFVLFYNMVYLNGNQYRTTSFGDFLIENYDEIKENSNLKAEFFFDVLYNIKYPNEGVRELSDKYNIYPFRMIFKLLSDKKIDRKITLFEFENLLSELYTERDYSSVMQKIYELREGIIPNISGEKIEKAPINISGWCNQFSVMKKEGEFIMISNELEALLPKLQESAYGFNMPFTIEFKKFVLERYLVDGLSMSNIENEYYNTTDRRGFLSRDVLEYFGVNFEENKAIYQNKNINTICNFLSLQSDMRYKNIARVLRGELEQLEEKELVPYTKEDFLKEVYLTSDEYDRLNNLLDKKMNVILEGAPGVGKTFMAKRLAYSKLGYKDDSKILMVQFHQSYSYEDFIEGMKPLKQGGFDIKSSVFKEFCNKAKADSNNNYYCIIDEINRGNISKILGELMTLMEPDKRDKEKVVLPYSNESLSIPSNLYIIGMLNTADRSLALIDYALRRRFSFYPRKPAFENELFKNYIAEQENKKLDKLIEIIKELNEEIKNDESLGEGFEIGHSYFCNLKNYDNEIEDIIEYDIKPMLKEYWFDEENAYKKWETILNGVINE